jgi:putative ABC transport system permease protein
VLLVGAGLLIKSFMRLQEVRPGFNPNNVLISSIALPSAKYNATGQRPEFFRQLAERLEALPGVQAVGGGINLPLGASNYGIGRAFVPEGRTHTTDESVAASYYTITGNFFRALQIPVLAGRVFELRDDGDAPKVVIVNEAIAKRFYGSPEGAIGKRLTIWRDEKFAREIIGVVGDTKADTLERENNEQIYVPHAQDPSWNFMALVIRTAGNPAAFVPVLRRELQAIDKDQPLYNIRTMDDVVRSSLGTRRVSMLLFSVFAGAALLLAAVGIYGVMAYSVTQRTHEIGIRMALGAQAGDVLRMVVRQGMTLVLIGIGVGLAGALGLTRVIANLLFGVNAADPLTFAAIALLLAVVALLACYLPARRAAKLDLMIALARP